MAKAKAKANAAESQPIKERFYDAAGGEVKDRAAMLAAAPEAATDTACLELRNGSVSFVIEVTYDPNTYPFSISGGSIKTGICGAPWEVTGGSMGANLRIDATRQGPGSCANTITVVGEFQGPPSWRGTYGFDGQSAMFRHTTLFQGWGVCP